MIKNLLRGFVFEYMTNNIIAHIPIERLRWIWYKFIMKVEVDWSAYLHMNNPQLSAILFGPVSRPNLLPSWIKYEKMSMKKD